MDQVVLVIHLMLAVSLVITVLLQQSEGGGLGIGGGGQGSMMTGRSAANLLTRLTTIIVGCFFVTSLLLAWMAKQDAATSSVFDGAQPAAVEQLAPAAEEKEQGIPQVPVSN